MHKSSRHSFPFHLSDITFSRSLLTSFIIFLADGLLTFSLHLLLQEYALTLFRKSLNNYQIVGERRNPDLVIAASIYLACRIEGVPRTILEMSLVSGANKSELGSFSFEVAQKLDLQLRPMLPEQFVNRVCSKISLPIEYYDVAVTFCRNVNKIGVLYSMAANTVAATIVLALSLGCRCTGRLHLLEEASFSTVGKIKKCYSVLHSVLGTVLPPNLPESFKVGRLPDVWSNNIDIFVGKKDLLKPPGQETGEKNNKDLAHADAKPIEMNSFDEQFTCKNRKHKSPCVWELSSLYNMKNGQNPMSITVPTKSIISTKERDAEIACKEGMCSENDEIIFSTEYANNGWSSLKKQKLSYSNATAALKFKVEHWC